MFIILLEYRKPLELIDQHLFAHRSFLNECYTKNYFLVSGPKRPRTGGVLISPLKDREKLEGILKQDPFYIHDVVDYEIIEFKPTKFHPVLADLI